MLPVIFTDFRREMIARTLFDLLKIVAAAAFASNFFLKFPKMVQLGMWLVIVAMVAGGVFCCPPQKPKE